MTGQTISLTDRIAWSDSQVGSVLNGNVVLLSMETGKYFSLDQISSDIWRRIEQPALVSELCDQLTVAYAADKQEVEQDVLELLVRLLNEQLIQLAG